jgi:DNA mismatch repair ATPase MutS
LKNYRRLNEALANEMSARQQAEQQYYNLVKQEEQLQKEVSNLKNENEKVRQHFEEKVKNLEKCFLEQEPKNQEAIFQLRKENERILAKVEEEYQLKINELYKRLHKTDKKKSNFLSKTSKIIGGVSAITGLASMIFGVPFLPPIF